MIKDINYLSSNGNLDNDWELAAVFNGGRYGKMVWSMKKIAGNDLFKGVIYFLRGMADAKGHDSRGRSGRDDRVETPIGK
jgi:hypothetical protein